MVVGQVRKAECLHQDITRHHAVDAAVFKTPGDLLKWDEHGDCAQGLQVAGSLFGRNGNPQVAELLATGDRPVAGVDCNRALGMEQQGPDLRKLLGQIQIVELHQGDVSCPRGSGGERKLECFDGNESAGGESREGPGKVDHTIGDLIIKFRRRPAQAHGRIDVDPDPSFRLLGNLGNPGLEETLLERRIRRQKVLQCKGELLGGSRPCHQGQERSDQSRSSKDHAMSLPTEFPNPVSPTPRQKRRRCTEPALSLTGAIGYIETGLHDIRRTHDPPYCSIPRP